MRASGLGIRVALVLAQTGALSSITLSKQLQMTPREGSQRIEKFRLSGYIEKNGKGSGKVGDPFVYRITKRGQDWLDGTLERKSRTVDIVPTKFDACALTECWR